ncbi:beta-propeller repeat-containing protein [Novosphingobium sp. PhB57]|nr:beta-propeller repeat-containing protein [Novosphingobium sp. PhB57]
MRNRPMETELTININNGLIGLSVLGGTSAYSALSSSLAALDSAAVLKAKKAFTLATPETTPPWQEAADTRPVSAQIVALKRMLSLVDTTKDSSLGDLPDVQTAFTTYKALDRLRILAESAAKATTSSTERASLQKTFAQGLLDLQSFLGSADTDLVSLYFGSKTSNATSVAIKSTNSSGAVIGEGVSATRNAAISGMTGSEVLQIKLTKGSTTETVNVDLSATTQPPTLDSVAAALNAAIGSSQALDTSGNPVVDANGDPISKWKSNFTVEKNDGKWGLVFNPAGSEKVAIDQVGGGDALMVASGETAKDAATAARVYRVEDLDDSLSWQRLSKLNAVDGTATADAKANASSTDDEDKDYTVAAATQAKAIATDSEGFSYVVGTTAGDVGTRISDGSDDLFLTKVDSKGNVVWQRSLGAAGSAQGAAVSIAANGDIVVAGTVDGAYNGGDDSQTDMLVARYNIKGDQLSATVIRQVGNETASAVTVGDDGSIYVAGKSSTGGGDAFIAKLDATGKLQERRAIDSGGLDSVTSLAIDNDGNLLALTSESGVATIHRIDSTSLSTDLGSITLGKVSARAIAVSDSGEIAVVGTTSSAVSGTQVNSINGGQDAFVTRIDAALSSASTTYIGTSATDQADSVTYLNGTLYVGGRTAGDLSGTKSGTVDGFVARIDASTGAIEKISQWGMYTSTTEPVKISAVAGGSTVLGALGLNRGTLNEQESTTLSSQTNLQAGDKFTIRVDGGATRTITIGKDETMVSLAQKIQKITGTKATITTPRVNGQTTLKIQVKSGYQVELGSGPDNKDALSKLGIDPVRLVASKAPDADAPKVTPGGTYSLGLATTLSVKDAKTAAVALAQIKSALSMTQTAYRSLYWDSSKATLVDGAITGGGTVYQQKQLANYQAALSRLTGS